jgi:hypothetical protein
VGLAKHVPGILTLRVARRTDGKYYLTIQFLESTQGIVVFWAPVSTDVFAGAPTIMCGTNGKLVIVGRKADNRLYVATNAMTATAPNTFVYDPNAWTAFASIGTQQFVGDPALTRTGCSFSEAYLAGQTSNNGPFMYTSSVTGSSFGAWQNGQNGLFLSSPTLAASCVSNVREVVILGRGFDNQIYSSTQISGGPPSFSAVAGLLAQGDPAASFYTPTATPITRRYRLIAIENGTGVPKSNSARR